MKNTNIIILVGLSIIITSCANEDVGLKNSKRTSNLINMSSALNIRSTEGTSLDSFVSKNNSKIVDISIAGRTDGLDEYYFAGNINYDALGVKKENFMDPEGEEYRIGVTTLKGGEFEFGSIIEKGNGSKTAMLQGNYNPRNPVEIEVKISTTKSNSIELVDNKNIGKINREDKIKSSQGTFYIIEKISTDGQVYTLDKNFDGSEYIELAMEESISLIKAKGSNNPVIEDSTEYLPY